jgi:hypothetical protein
MKATRSFATTALVLAALAALVAVASAKLAPGTLAAPGTDKDITAALSTLPMKVKTKVVDLMASLNMTANTTHFQRFVSREAGAPVINQSMALIK